MKRIAGVMTGLLCLAAVPAAPSWAGMTGFGPGQSLRPADALIEAEGSKAPETVEQGSPTEVEWISIPGGKFMMGTSDSDDLFFDATDIHEVAIKDFEMSKTEVTVEQYARCVAKGPCTKPDTGRRECHWGFKGRERYPVNCLDWKQARQYAKFAGARLPSEAEWEYAARSAGKDQAYPWGDEEPTVDKAVYYMPSSLRVCSRPAGNTAQGLCDMAGNVWEWTQDSYEISYNGAPSDGSAWETKGPLRVTRGGSRIGDDRFLRVYSRNYELPSCRQDSVGFRLARSAPAKAP